MEYVEGLDLSKMVKAKGPLPVAHACNFVYQAALGLQHAHEEGLVHRDIKPGNLMLSRKGDKATVKILDFGLAKATREERTTVRRRGPDLGDGAGPRHPRLHRPRTDPRRPGLPTSGPTSTASAARSITSLTGRPPFQANSLYDIYQAHISRTPTPLNLVRPEVPAELAALVAKMMAKDPARRFQTPGRSPRLAPFFKKQSAGAEPTNTRAFPVSTPDFGLAAEQTTGPGTHQSPIPPWPGRPSTDLSRGRA